MAFDRTCNTSDGRNFLHPSQVHFLMIDKCNARCIMCGGDYYRSKSGRKITFEAFKRMAANLQLEKVASICLAGAGDPLLNPDLLDIIAYVNERYPSVAVSITTNGIALLPALADQLMTHVISFINISINAATRLTYKQIMQVDQFERVVENARYLASLRQYVGSPTSLQFSIALNELNIGELPQLVALTHSLGFNSVNAMYCRYYPKELRSKNIIGEATPLDDDTSLFYHQELSDFMVQKAAKAAHRLQIGFTHEPLFSDKAPLQNCSWTEHELMVGFDGEVYPCGGGELHFKQKVENGTYHFGNALTESIDQFWNNETYCNLRISSRQGDISPIPECHCCANLKSPSDRCLHFMDWEGYDLTGSKSEHPISDPSEPLVSIIVPTINRPDMLRETIQSILDQTYRNFEIIVVNDAGQDVSDVIASFGSSRIIYLTHPQNKGLAASRNTGIRAAQGKYVAYLDDDDIYYPNHLETLVSHLESTDCYIAYTDSYQANQKLIEDSYQTVNRTLEYSRDFDYELILVQNFIPVLCFMHDRAIIDEVGYFDETLRSHEDWDLWVRVSREYRLDHLPIITSEYRWRDDGSTMTSSKAADYYTTAKAIYHKIRMSIAVSQETIQKQEASLMGRRNELYQLRLNILCSIIIPVYNKLELTIKCLETLFAHTSERMFELVIVDNASSDGTGEYLKKLDYGKFKLISNQYNVGYTIACNQGAMVATGKYLVFLNNDTEPKDGWLDYLVAIAEQDLLIGAVGSKLIYPDGKLQEAGAIINKDGSNDSIGNGGDPNDPKYNAYKDVDYCTGASLLVRHDLFKEAGGVDERYAPAYYEDPDLCFSIRELGYRIIYCPESEVIHHESATAGTDKITGIKKFYWINRVKFCEKWRNILEAKPNRPDIARLLEKPITRPVTVIDGIFYQLASTGIARLWTSLLTEWSKLDFSPTVILLDRAGTAPKIEGIRSRTIPPYEYEAPENDRAFLQALCDEEGADLFVSTYYTTPLTTPSVFFAYDMIPENTHLYNLQDPVWQVKHFGITHALTFIAISMNTGKDLIEFYPPAANKVSIAYPGIDTKRFYPSSEQDVERFRQKYSLAKPYFLFVGNRHYHKNGRLLFEGLACVANRDEYSVVCVGAMYKSDLELARLVPDVSVKVLPLSDDELRTAYSGAIALVYPSIYEGFGLPILEAMACDCPVITCHNTSLPEVAGAAALYVAQDRAEEMAIALQNIQQPEVRTQLIKMGRRQIQKFSWENMAVAVQQALTKTYREEVLYVTE